ncbi:MAG: hypothetical protein KAI24_15500, partial [Planctomycetes bacterium]|nr:hypothetical protein [Planctomycetota bacterium]
MWFETPIDQFCVASGFAEVDRESLVVHHVDGEDARGRFRKTYSDHFPCTATLLLTKDDDPTATFAKGPAAQVLPASRRQQAAEPARAPTAAEQTSTWPPPVGSSVMVLLDKTAHRGTLHKPLPELGGWVVIEKDGELVGFPMRNVQRIVVKD